MPSDTFTGANNDPLSGNWTVTQGTWQIFNNQATATDNVFPNIAVWDADPFADDQYAQAVFNYGANGSGLGVRLSLAAVTGYYFRCASSTEAVLERLNAGTPTELATFTGLTQTPGDVWRLEISGSTLALKQNGSPLSPATGSLTDGAPIASGSAGMTISGNGTPLLDDFQADNAFTGLSVSIGEAVIGGSLF